MIFYTVHCNKNINIILLKYEVKSYFHGFLKLWLFNCTDILQTSDSMDTRTSQAVEQYNSNIGSFFHTAAKFEKSAEDTDPIDLTEEDKSIGYHAKTLIEHTKSSVVKTVEYLFKATQRDKSEMVNISDTNMKMLKCCFCIRHFDNTANLRKHLEYKHDLGKHKDTQVFPCDECGKTFGSDHNLRQHKRFKHTNKANVDGQKDKDTNNTEHKQINSTQPQIPCEHCNRLLDNNFNLKQHMKYKHPNVSLQVETHKDKKQSMTKDNSQVNKTSKVSKLQVTNCDKCQKAFNNHYNKSIHSCRQMNGKVISCDKCQQKFRNFHNKIAHNCKGNEQPEFVTCNKCFRQYAANKYPEHHCPNHCKTCDKVFTYANEYVSHKVSCFGYGYSCYYCKFVFTTREQARKHQRYCKPFPCSVCKRSYASNNDLAQHYKEMHTVYPSTQCRYCTESFYTTLSLKKHLDENHADKKDD